MTRLLRSLCAALAAASLLGPSCAVGAQDVDSLPRRASIWVGGGWAFPSGGDWSDTYGPGPAGSLDLRMPLDARWSLRAGLSAAGYMPQAFRGHPKGPSFGSTFGLSSGVAYDVPLFDDRIYLVAGAGLYAVSGTWLTAVNTIAPYKTQIVFGLEQGIGFRLGGPWVVEARHHMTFRPERNWARFIPLTIGYRLSR